MRTAIAILSLATVVAYISESRAAPAVQLPRHVQKWAIHAPRPHYPAGAQAWRATGTGIFVLRVQIKSGLVKAVDIARGALIPSFPNSVAATLRGLAVYPERAHASVFSSAVAHLCSR